MEESHSLPHSHSHRSPSDNASSHVSSAVDHVTDGGSSGGGAGSNYGAKYRLMSPAKLPISRSTCITIPPGLSPTSFLESPVLLSNIKAEPSPTTGSLFKPSLMHNTGDAVAVSSGDINDERASDSFEFRFHAGSSSAPGLPSFVISAGSNRNGLFNQNDRSSQSPKPLSIEIRELTSPKELGQSVPVSVHDSSICSSAEELSQGGNSNFGVLVGSSDHKDSISQQTTDRTSDDGYNWRKYGQKLVKGSEFPRSYYKCTHPNCEVKKIFERSPSGQITEIVYKGSHDHPKPQLARRQNPGLLVSIQEGKIDSDLPFSGQEDKLNPNLGPNVSPTLSPLQANAEGLDRSGSQFQGINEDIDEDDPFSKRRRMDDGLDLTPIVKPIREPRVVVQTVSEVDILDDGYRWRKYGQKVVRGNPNPRSYYKCTSATCPVRKHVERASHDPKAVITTYEGKHNHEVPAARNNHHEFSGTIPHSGIPKARPEESSSSISLDLGVGISHAAENRTNEHVNLMESEATRGQMIPNNIPSMMVPQGSQIPACYSIVNGGLNLYGNRENHVDAHSFLAPPIHPSNQCPPNLGRILMGP